MRATVFGFCVGVFVLGAALTGCSVETNATSSSSSSGLEGAPQAATEGERYTIELYVADTERLYLITDAQDGTRVAARVAQGASSLLDAAEARALFSERQGVLQADGQETVSFSIPGFSMRIEAQDSAEGAGDNARVSVDIAGRQLEVNAADTAGAENAQVRLAGMTAQDTKEFIVNEDELDPGVQQQMLDALGL